MTANHSQYMILDADDSDMERRGRRNRAYSRGPALPLIRNQHSPDRTTLEEIAREQHPDDSPRETQQQVQLMQRHLEENRRVTYRSERHEVVFDPVKTSTPPIVNPPTPQPAAATETRPAWVIKLEQDLATIQQQEQQQQQAAQLA